MIKFIDVNNNQVLYWLSQAESMDMSGTGQMKFKGFTESDDYTKIRDQSISKEYLDRRLRNIHEHKIEFAFNKLVGETAGGAYLLRNLKTILNYTEYFTSGYDTKGFVGWHSDSDIAGYYISFVYQGEGNGVLKYRDVDSGEIVDFVNAPGWNVFSYVLGSKKENMLWHAAVSDSKRFSFLIKFASLEDLNKAINILATNP